MATGIIQFTNYERISNNKIDSNQHTCGKFNILASLAVFFYVLNPLPLFFNFHISDLLIVIFYLLNFNTIINNSFNSNIYRKLFPIFYCFALFSLLPGFNADYYGTHFISIIQFSFVFFIQIPSLMLFMRNQSTKFLRLSVIGIVSAIILLVLFYFFNISFNNLFYYHRGFGARTGISSIMDMGFLIAFSALMGHQLLVRNQISKTNFFILLILCVGGLIMTATRSAIGMVLIYCIVLAVTYSTLKKLRVIISTFIILLGLNYYMSGMIDNPLKKNYDRLLTVTKMSTFIKSDRVGQYKKIPNLVSRYPYGIGYNNLQASFDKSPIHNIFLLILVEGGILPFIFFCSIWLIIIASIIFNNNGYQKKYSMAIIISFLFYISTVSNIYDRNFWLIVVYTISMADSIATRSRFKEKVLIA
jgi:hypothetical protein